MLSPRSLPSTGSATFSTEKSRATMNWAAHSTNRTSRARPESRGGPEAEAEDAAEEAAEAEVGGVSIAMRPTLRRPE
ncbi:hypothetical protein GA0115255_123473 [Streptomyces sp. Ncost-T6T-2b]|nr:hypothetical protein GA0115255_123473 [Streptomyces sp. Ncost-T6T-2b]